MRAVRVHEFGDPDVLQVEEVPQPEPVQGEVLVRVQAAGVNPFEAYVRAGRYTELPALPYTPGCDAAGVRLDTGERVYVTDSLSGTYAEYALCPSGGRPPAARRPLLRARRRYRRPLLHGVPRAHPAGRRRGR